jgi:hypothetical protein
MEQFTYDELDTLQYVLLVHMNTNINSDDELYEVKALADKIILLRAQSYSNKQ